MKRRMTFLLPGLLMASCGLLALACHSKPRTPAPPNYYQTAETSFEAGDYAAALAAYETYLRQNPAAPNRDRALFRIGLGLALASAPLSDLSRSMESLKRLVNDFPLSQYRPQAELILKLEEELSRNQTQISESESQLQGLTGDRERLQKETEKLRAEVSQRDARIKQLRNELEQLKKIDFQKKKP